MSYIGRQPQIGNFQICDAISTVNNQAAYTMQVGSVNVIPETAQNMIVSLNGVIQKPNSSYTVAGAVITFSSALVTGDVINFIQILGSVLDLGTPSDDTVSTAKIVNGAVTSAKLASGVGGVAGITSSANATAITITDAELVQVKNANDTGGLLSVSDGDSGAGTHADANELVLENNGAAGLSILSFNNNYGNIYFADGQDNDIGKVTYLHTDNSMSFTTNTAVGLKIDGGGHVTKPLQPAVHAYLNGTQSNISTGITTVQLNSEIYDVNSDFNTSNYTFTAPVTGKYLVTMNLVMTDVDTAFQWIYLLGVSSNRNYYLDQIDPRIEMVADGIHTWTGSSLVDMDANDTFIMKTRSSAHGAAQMDIAGGTANSTETTMTMTLLS